jgi:hypothetical protein
VPPQPLDRGADRVLVGDLAVDDRAERQGRLREALQDDGPTADRQLGRAHGRGADVQTDDVATHQFSLSDCCAAAQLAAGT